MTYYIILAMLSEAPDRTLRMTELAAMAGTSQSQLSHAATRLEEAGWIERRRCLDDKRGYEAVLTDSGFEMLTRAAPSHVESVRSVLFDALTPAQVDQLHTIARRSSTTAADRDGDHPAPDAGHFRHRTATWTA